MIAQWKKCKKCRRVARVSRDMPVYINYTSCQFCGVRLHFVKRDQIDLLEAAWHIGGITAAQEIATPGRAYEHLL